MFLIHSFPKDNSNGSCFLLKAVYPTELHSLQRIHQMFPRYVPTRPDTVGKILGYNQDVTTRISGLIRPGDIFHIMFHKSPSSFYDIYTD